MWSKLRKGWDRIHLFVAVIIAILGFVYFISQALDYSETLPPVAPDEGMNLYQGYLFATGRYQPFEDYGPWSFQMPVSYLIPGLVQARYGPGMEVGRLYAVVVGAIAVLGLWLTVQRNSTLWWAAAAVWAIALNPTYVQYFSQARTEALVSMLFSWMLFFGLGAERQDWELAVAGFLAWVAGMAHLNVLLVLPLYILYVFWQFDRRAGLSVLAAGLLPVAFVHIAYWPDVLRVWAGYIRPELFSWADEYSPPARGNILPANFSWWPVTDWIGDRGHLAWVGLRALGQTLRVHFLVFFGVLTTLLLWPWRRKLRPGGRSITKVFFNQHKQVVFLLITFLTLFVVYLRGANGITCQFSCLPGNIMYFFVFGLILVPISYTGWREEMPIWKQVTIIMIIFLLLITLEYNFNSNYLEFRHAFIRNTFDLTPPWLEFGMLVEGEAKIWEILENKFGINHFPLRQFILNSDQAVHWVRMIKVIGYMIIVIPVAYQISEKYTLGPENFGSFALTFTLLIGFIFSWSRASGGFLTMDTCQESVIDSYEKVGQRLDRVIPDDAQLYWEVKDNMLLLYMPKKEVFTPQLSAKFTFLDHPNTDSERLYRFGWWDDELRDEWIEEADFIVIENRSFSAQWRTLLAEGEFEQVYQSQPAASCRGDASRILVFEPSP